MIETEQQTRTAIVVRIFATLIVVGILGAMMVLFIIPEDSGVEPLGPSAGGFFDTTLMDRINETQAFLASHKNGQPYTPDPRPLTPTSEVVRLNIDAQALGYLNLYKSTNNAHYRDEAVQRLDYLYDLGDEAIGTPGGFMGQVGYSFLYAYQLLGDERYKTRGMEIADKCTILPNSEWMMNWGYMCAMNVGLAYDISGNVSSNAFFRDIGRIISRQTSSKQFADGAFSHRVKTTPKDLRPYFGENTHYTSWLVFEMLQYRRSDPQNPDVDDNIIRAVDFLSRRVNADGSLNYQDAAGSYYSDDPRNADSRGWMNELATVAYNLRAVGQNDKAKTVLQFLFSKEMSGDNLGAYPDKWGWTDPTNIWTTGNPSITRTSQIFWYLTSLSLIRTDCVNGEYRNCVPSADDCNAGLRELGACSDPGPSFPTGRNTCIDGAWTQCMIPSFHNYPISTSCPSNPLSLTWCNRRAHLRYNLTCSYAPPALVFFHYVDQNQRKCTLNGSCSSYCVGLSQDNPSCSLVATSDACGRVAQPVDGG